MRQGKEIREEELSEEQEVHLLKVIGSLRLNKLFEINDCMKMLSCIYFLMNLIQFRTSKTEL